MNKRDRIYYLNSEINTLGYPRSALFGFCITLVAYSVMSVVIAAIGSEHGADFVDKNVSCYYEKALQRPEKATTQKG